MATWTIDPTHSEIAFKVKHLMISTVTGKFERFEGTVETPSEEDFSGSKINFSAAVDSITTGMEMRDNHLKSDDFFNAEKYPMLDFVSTSFEKTGAEKYLMKGNMTIRDITLPIALVVQYSGSMVDFYGNQKAGFEISGSINRQEFGLKWNSTTEAGGIVASDEVRLSLDIQLQKNS